MKRTGFILLGCLVFLLGSVALVSAQYNAPVDTSGNVPKMIRGGVLNGKATSLPKPIYPEDAKKDRAGGPVSVQVTIDEEGNVIEATALAEFKVTGADGNVEMKSVHPALQEASEKAALGAKFSPTKLSGQPVKVMGTIVYNFMPGDPEPSGESTGVGNRGLPFLNGKATYLPAPVYPPAARAVRAGGEVIVKVTVDENGLVIAAEAVAGHPLLRAASVEAAKQTQFSPAFVDGQAVKVNGVITYNFDPSTTKEN